MYKSKIVVRAIEMGLVVWLLYYVGKLFLAGDKNAAFNNAVFALAIVAVAETTLWLFPRLAPWAKKKWHITSDEVFFRGVQGTIIAAMLADVVSLLITGAGFGVNYPGCLLAVVIIEGIIRRFVRPDPRPPVIAQALKGIQANVKVFTQLPSETVRETLGLVRGISDIEASSRLDFQLAEQEALYLMLMQAEALGANAVVDARLTTGTYETNGSQWQVSRPVYTGTAVRI
jgi:uncharacterized protein YbjQ (UPF0145 family)